MTSFATGRVFVCAKCRKPGGTLVRRGMVLMHVDCATARAQAERKSKKGQYATT